MVVHALREPGMSDLDATDEREAVCLGGRALRLRRVAAGPEAIG
jgi:hypothetical protein